MFIVVNIIPTGIGAQIGGFAGDSNPVNTLLEEISDIVVTNPNSVNAASLFSATKKTFYTEGYALDLFLSGKIFLKRKYNKIGIIIDKKAVSKKVHIINAINACKSVFGAYIKDIDITDKEVNAKVIKNHKNLFDGLIENKEELLKSANRLISKGCNAIAVFCVIENDYYNDDELYLNGKSPDPIGRIEAIISHYIVENTGLPSAHAPIFLEDYEKKIVDPRVAAEEIGYTYIPCVIRGLQHAPQYLKYYENNSISIDDVSCIIVPYNCFNGNWIKFLKRKDIPIIMVENNKTILDDKPLENLNIIKASNYLESIGIISCIKSGIDYKSVIRPFYSNISF
ncbi:MAG: hypothetical protein KatS3mg068_0723 [Candidatus Sericytochromatia bacterium]|nr:MAG: hypothetical protein KatS3mg068_0723 [Candidatus Sericytochromatia bacterium]